LRVDDVLAFDTQPNQIARIGKTHNLAPAVGQNLVEADGTVDPIEISDRVPFRE
jgi:hypothetical protein